MTAHTKNNRFDFEIKTHLKNVRSSLATVAGDIAHGFFVITHSSFALLGLAVVFAAITLMSRPDLRNTSELKLMEWLQERREVVIGSQDQGPAASAPPAAAQPRILSRQQAAVASWISKKYSVAQEPVGTLVAEAFEIGHKVNLDPTLILAVMAIESRFNPFAQSPVGAQGLMQVMTRVHHDKYANVGGKLAAFDPVTNLRVGVMVLLECISRAGSIEGGLKYYVGAANLASDGGYTAKVMAEHARLKAIAGGKRQPDSGLFASRTPSHAIPVSLSASPSAKESDEKAAAERVTLLSES